MSSPGFYGLSNGPFAQPWPKTMRLSHGLERTLDGDASMEDLFGLLGQSGPLVAGDTDGAPIFIANETYGTRCSTVVTLDADGRGTIAERRFDDEARATGETALDFRWS